MSKKLRINEQIRSATVRLVNDKGDQLGIVPTKEAIAMAQEGELDLVEVAPQSEPPVCRIMDYGKYQYKLRKKHQTSRAKSHAKVLKEIRLHPKTDSHDIGYRIEHAREFLQNGHKVQVNMFFKGREMAHVDIGREVLMRFVDSLTEVSKVERAPKLEGRKMGVLLTPKAV